MMLSITTPEDIGRAARALQQRGDTWHGPLFRAAMVGELNFAMVTPGVRTPDRFLQMNTTEKPLMLILAGDSQESAGPDEFLGLWRPMKWAKAILLHGAGGEERHYTEVVDAARLVRRVLVVETSSNHLPAWDAARRRLAACTPALIITTRPGIVHPVAPEARHNG